MRTKDAPRHRYRQTVTAKMDACSFERERHVESVIDEELSAVRHHDLPKVFREREKIFPAEVALSQLYRSPPRFQRLGEDRD
jgi:hypothetical protein